MVHDVPPELAAFLNAPDAGRRDAAWARFVDAHSRLLLHVARMAGGSHDAVMDRYAFILEHLRADGGRRLRLWMSERRSKLTTWLVVVAQRLSLDEHRQRYGRPRATGDGAAGDHVIRRRLADLVTEEMDAERIGDPALADTPDADHEVRRTELMTLLYRAVAELPASDRLLVALRFRDGLSAAEIARATGASSQFQVYRRLESLLDRLRDVLKSRGVESSVP